jgi:ABC-type glutathione transport system ATPase component
MSVEPAMSADPDRPVGHLLDAELLHEPVAAGEPALSEYILEARGVRKRYGRTEVLRGVSLGIHRGDVKAVLGPSGSGKSTLLRCLALLEPLDAGEVLLEGQRIGSREGRRGRLEPLPERGSASPSARGPSRPSCRVASNSASPSRGRWS